MRSTRRIATTQKFRLAIVPSILHYTEPGDVVLDGFCGSGMTGVAAQWCGTAPAAYRVQLETQWKAVGHSAPKWGARRVVLNDLSPAATFIAAELADIPFDTDSIARESNRALAEVASELGWMYETRHTDEQEGQDRIHGVERGLFVSVLCWRRRLQRRGARHHLEES